VALGPSGLGGSAAIVTGIVQLVRRHLAPPDGSFTTPGPQVSVFGFLGTAFAALRAFVVFLAFGSYVRALEEASREAVAVTQLVRVSRSFPDEHRETSCGAFSPVTPEQWSPTNGRRWQPQSDGAGRAHGPWSIWLSLLVGAGVPVPAGWGLHQPE